LSRLAETLLKNRGQMPLCARAILKTETVFWFALFCSTTQFSQPVDSTDSTGFLFPAQVAIGQRVARVLLCQFATPRDNVLTAFFAAKPEITAVVSAPEGRSPRIYAILCLTIFFAHKCVSVDDVCACRWSLFGHFEADSKPKFSEFLLSIRFFMLVFFLL